jgi:FkbM family methyltransferase
MVEGPAGKMIQRIKDWLVSLGPDNALVKMALSLHARRQGFQLEFGDGRIAISKGHRRMLLSRHQYNLVPISLEDYDHFFEWICASARDGYDTLDFSQPAFQTYAQLGVAFRFPGIPEDYSLEAYTHWYKPQIGDLVFDVGAHAGMTTYFLSKMVGPSGSVIAFEPDTSNHAYLLQNIEYHGLKNVTPVAKAMSGKSGTATFNMDGTMAAGLSEYLIYPNTGRQVAVETMSLAEACGTFGVPAFVKMDIEGAEVDVIKAALPLLRQTPINLAFDSYHRLRDGTYSAAPLEEMLRSTGYSVGTSREFGEMFTWARSISQSFVSSA